ncbi:MAG: phosphodiester glycosidase family protein, partial [Bacteroidales bacterium]|nr:phosphodiester glycosidase family protein [Bacteroidales bacterium]
ALGCRDAINLDGGGSTTMVVSGRIVNHPCDNRKFDPAGERSVANAICISRE